MSLITRSQYEGVKSRFDGFKNKVATERTTKRFVGAGVAVATGIALGKATKAGVDPGKAGLVAATAAKVAAFMTDGMASSVLDSAGDAALAITTYQATLVAE